MTHNIALNWFKIYDCDVGVVISFFSFSNLFKSIELIYSFYYSRKENRQMINNFFIFKDTEKLLSLTQTKYYFL